jgi:histidinol-phosphate/aromatic aminotransferase/cobyric acid decarboxylase-like protein/adenosyl cobinamide kinase/adenosyl cobinamide phosphate guanylyltransferase
VLTLVLGGIRSGKSEVAERLAAASGSPVIYLATYAPAPSAAAAGRGATSGRGSAADPEMADPEMAERVARHRERRPAGWRTIECADPLAALGPRLDGAGAATVLVDGLGGWLCALMETNGLFTADPVAAWGADGLAGRDRVLEAVSGFALAAARREAETIVVADEVGLGGVPPHAASRRFADLSGEAGQVLARVAASVWLVVAGQALALTGPPPEGRAAAPPDRLHGVTQGGGPDGRAAPGVGALDLLGVHGDREVPLGHLNFAVSVIPGGPPQAVRSILAGALGHVEHYPDEGRAIEALAARHGRSPDEVLVLNGAAEAFWLVGPALQPGAAVCVHPSFTEPERALRSQGIAVSRAFRDPDNFSLVTGNVDASADLVVLGNPNNPTGTLDPAATVVRLARPGRTLVVDEAFMDLVASEGRGGGPGESVAGRRDVPGLVVVRSLTKVWSLPGLRAGYLLGPPEIVAAMRAARQPWGVSAPALAVLEAYGRGDIATADIAAATERAATELVEALHRLPGVAVWPPAANFVLIRVPGGPRVREGLRAAGIAVRRAETFPGLTTDHLRISVRGRGDNARLVTALRTVLDGLRPGGSRA